MEKPSVSPKINSCYHGMVKIRIMSYQLTIPRYMIMHPNPPHPTPPPLLPNHMMASHHI